MASEPDVIRHQIEQTRESLTEKIETLEEQVKGTIQDVKDTVENTVDAVTEKVQDTVDSIQNHVEGTVAAVRRTFDIPYQVQQHPWAMAGCSLLAGMTVGYFLASRRPLPPYWASRRSTPRPDIQGFSAPPPPAPQGPSLVSRLLDQFEPEIEKVKGMAIGALLGMARDYIKQVVPPNLAPNLEEVLDGFTRKMGGQPVHGPVLSQEPPPRPGPGSVPPGGMPY